MKRIGRVTIMTFVLGLFFSAGAFAEEKVKVLDKSISTGQTQTMLHSAEQFIGTEVRDQGGNEIGEVKDVVFNFDRGIGFAVVSSEELSEIDETYLVPLSAFTNGHEGEFVTLSMQKEDLANYPKRDLEMDDETYSRTLYDYYGISYPWEEGEDAGRAIVPGSERQHQLTPTGEKIKPGAGG